MKKFWSLLFISLVSLCANAQLLYRVTGNGLDKPSYLFGTHHMAPVSIMDSVPSLYSIVSEVECVIGEVDMSMGQMAMAMKLQPHMIAPKDSTLSKVLTPEVYAYLDSVMTDQVGVGLQMLDMMKPAVVQNMLLIPMIKEDLPDFNPDAQIDMLLQEMVTKNGGSVLGLETVEDQAYALFEAKSIAQQAEELMEFVSNPDDPTIETRALTEAYMNQDMEAMLELSKDIENDATAYEELLLKRNARWMDKLPELLNEHSSLVVVGALHLAGVHGLVQALRDLGYTVTPIR